LSISEIYDVEADPPEGSAWEKIIALDEEMQWDDSRFIGHCLP
jgi:hypothetical protein